jgi:broad-specificity NMP kinase
MPKAPVLLLSGSPGCGKTTIAPLVADGHEPAACLDLDWFFAKVRRGFIEPWRDEAHTQNRVILRAAAHAVVALAEGGYFTVAEGIVYPFMLDIFTEACAPQGIELNYAVLRAPIRVVQQRVRDRRSDPEHFAALADADVVGDLWSQFESHGVEERHHVDSDGQTPDLIAEEIDRRLRAGEFRL